MSRRDLLILALIVGCAPDTRGGMGLDVSTASWGDVTPQTESQRPPPATMTMAQGAPLYLGEVGQLRVSGATPGTRVHLVASVASGATPFCPGPLAGACLDLPAPARYLGAVTATSSGQAVFSLRPPTTLGERPVRFQAVEVVGGLPAVSDVWRSYFYERSGDVDGDGLTNELELETYGTDPQETDSDGGGAQDGDEVSAGTDPLDASDDDGGAARVAVTITRDAIIEPVRDLFGTNKDPDFLRFRTSGTQFNAASLYEFIGITQVRLHDGDVDLCDIYQPATLYDLENGGAVLSDCRGSGDPSDHHRWDVDDAADVDDPSSYDFSAADASVEAVGEAGARVYIRLGESFQGPNDTATPALWSRVAANIASHYLGAFGDPVMGVDVAALEIGNEPGGSFWVGPAAAFYDLYEQTFDLLATAHPAVLAGGPGFRHQAVDEFGVSASLPAGFLQQVDPAQTPFVSGHYYAGCEVNSPQASMAWLDEFRHAVDDSGRADVPLHISEWNIGLECGNELFAGTEAQTFAASLLTLMQEPSLLIEAAHQYAGVGIQLTLVSSSLDETSDDLFLNPIAWALWAHRQLLGLDKVQTQLCEGGSCSEVADAVRAGGELVAMSATGGDGVYVVISNDSADARDILVRDTQGLSASRYVFPGDAPYTVETSDSGGVSSPTTAALAALEASVTTEPLTQVSPGTWSLSLEPHTFALLLIE